MNVVFLSPHFPPNYKRFCLNLRQAGAVVLGLGDYCYIFRTENLDQMFDVAHTIQKNNQF